MVQQQRPAILVGLVGVGIHHDEHRVGREVLAEGRVDRLSSCLSVYLSVHLSICLAV